MGDSLYMLLLGGLFFIFLGIYMWKKEKDELHLMTSKMIEKENDLLELYESLEEIMNQIHYFGQQGLDGEAAIAQEDKNSTNDIKIDLEAKGDFTYNDIFEDNNPPIMNEGETSFSGSNKYSIIKELQTEGLGVEEIAKRLGMGKGEVELFINFARKQ